MAGIANSEFTELAQNRLNYLAWASDVEIFLASKDLTKAIGMGPSQNSVLSPPLRMPKLCIFFVTTSVVL